MVSPGNLARLKAVGSRKAVAGHVEVRSRPFDRDEIAAHAARNPRQFRDFVAHAPADYGKEELTTTD
jgi:hypothetical protein